MGQRSKVHGVMNALILLFFGFTITANAALAAPRTELVALFEDWRSFEQPPLLENAPDYRQATFQSRNSEFQVLRDRLMSMDISSWTNEQQVDWHVVRAEMNGYDFNQRVLMPWARDPAFYFSIWAAQSDVPAHEGPTHHAVVEVWQYDFPLSADEIQRLSAQLEAIPALYAQARINLTGNARDLWVAGARVMAGEQAEFDNLAQKIGDQMEGDLARAFNAAKTASSDFVEWLDAQSASKTGPSGIGKDNYTWYQQNVHLVPMTWDDEVRLLQRELDRAWAALKFEEHRNRNLPQLVSAESPEAYDALAEKAVRDLIDFLKEKEIVTVADYFEPALRQHMGQFVPIETRNFFAIGSHYDPKPLFSHFYHWFELARMEYEPHPNPIRRNALLYNIFDSRNEGTATAVEEMFMQAGLYDDNPRGREIVLIMVAQRAARGLGSLYAHANEMTMEEAGAIHLQYTPRGWMKTEPELVQFEQHLYLRQPGYGTSYITGKYLLERALADYGRLKEEANEPFQLKDFFDTLNAIGNIPIALGRMEMTGLTDDIERILNK